MPALNFTVFIDKVEQGLKRCSIRAGHRFQAGQTLYLYTGMRTKKCRRLGVALARRVRQIVILPHVVLLDDVYLSQRQIAALARRDGFDSLNDFFAFFRHADRSAFRGQLIEW